MIIKPSDKRVRFSERWQVRENYATSTANGSTMECIFRGKRR